MAQALYLLLVLLPLVVSELSQLDPDIPRDKCGVAVAVNFQGQTELIILGSDKALYYKLLSDGLDSPWVPLGGNFLGGPAVVRNNDGKLELFGRGHGYSIWHKYQADASNAASWTAWMDIGRPLTFASDPVAILSSEGFIHLFAKGADNTLMHKTQFSNNTLYVWTEWTSLGGALTSQPAVLLDAEGLLHVFVRGPDRALWHKAQIGGQEPRFVKWSEWQSLGGVLASSPRVPIALNTVNLLEIFVRASDKAYWHRCQVASLPSNERELDWNEWQSLGGVFSSGPSVVLNGNGLLDTFGRGADKAIWHKAQFLSKKDSKPTWSNWVSLHGITSTGPAARVRLDGLIDVFVRGVDKQIWMKSQFENGNSTDFRSWRSLGPGSGQVEAEAFSC